MKAAPKHFFHKAQVVTFVPTKNFKPAQKFYESTLGLPLIAKDKFALMFEVGGTRIRIAKVAEFEPAPFTILGWRVASAKDAVAAMTQRGVVFERFPGMTQDESGIWTAPSGARVAWFKDPDGNMLSVSEQIG
jgi:catechol 2,3-dioxygenase-like lactoylglutathione lyase family enzyme